MTPMSNKERFDHIWYHFKWHIIAILLCIIAVVSIFVTMIGNHKDSVIGGGLLNVSTTETGTAFLTDNYLYAEGYSRKKYQATLYAPGIVGMDSDELNQNANFTISFMTMLGAKKFDYLILDEAAMNYYKEQGLFMNLASIFSADELQNLSSSLVHSDTYDEDGNALGQMYPIGICIDSLPFAKNCIESDSPVYLVFAGNAPHSDRLVDFYKYLCSWKPTS